MKKKLLSILSFIFLVNVFMANAQIRTLEYDAKYTEETFEIDGLANEQSWDQADFEFNGEFVNFDNGPDYYANPPAISDLDAQWKVVWSADGIHLFAEVTDDSIVGQLDPLKEGSVGPGGYDNWETYFHVPYNWGDDLKSSPGDTADGDYIKGTWQLRNHAFIDNHWTGRSYYYSPRPGGGWHGGQGVDTLLYHKWEYKYVKTDKGYNYEAFYPFDILFAGVSAPIPEKSTMRSIGFETSCTDADGLNIENKDGGREGGVAWNTPTSETDGKDKAWGDKTYFGKLNLTTEEIQITSIFDRKIHNTLKVYPNVFSDKINIVSDQRVTEIKIINVVGKQIYSERNLSGIETIVLDKNIQSGIYFLIANTASSDSQSIKLIKK